MPTRFTAQQLAASASAGEPRSEESFGGDRDAWHAYQAEWFATITLGEVLPAVGDSNRPKRWCSVPALAVVSVLAPAPEHEPEERADAVPAAEPGSEPESESKLDHAPDCGCCHRRSRGGDRRKKPTAFARLMGRMDEDFSWMDSDSDDGGPFLPF